MTTDPTCERQTHEGPPARRWQMLLTIVCAMTLLVLAAEIDGMLDAAAAHAGGTPGQAAAGATSSATAAASAAPGASAAAGERRIRATRALQFVDDADGAIRVLDAGSGRVVYRIEPGADGFMRALMRGLARDRRLSGIGPEVPFHLRAFADGALRLEDPVTHRRVELNAFGPTNAAAFAALL